MLGWMRKQTRSWFVYIAFAIIIVVFVFFYGWRGGGSPDEAAVAIVNGESITRKQYEKGCCAAKHRTGSVINLKKDGCF